MARQVISQQTLNRLRARGGKVRIKKPSYDDFDSDLEEAAIGPQVKREAMPVAPEVPQVPAPAPVAAPPPPAAPPPELGMMRAKIATLEAQLTATRERAGGVVSELRASLAQALAKANERKLPVAWTHKIRRTSRGLIGTIISWRTGENLVAWTHEVLRTPQGLVDTIESTDGVTTLRHTVSRRNGSMDKIHTTVVEDTNRSKQ